MRDYTYATARVTALAQRLLAETEIEHALQNGYGELVSLLEGRGYTVTDGEVGTDVAERKLWELMSELVGDDVLRVLKLPNDYRNIKTAVRSLYLNADGSGMLADNGNIDKAFLYDKLVNGDFSELPRDITECFAAAYEYLKQTDNVSGTDILIDKIMFDKIYRTARGVKEQCLTKYVEYLIDLYNLKTVRRCVERGYDITATERAMSPLGTLNIRELSETTVKGYEGIARYMQGTAYSLGENYVKRSSAAFENWCDGFLLSKLKELAFDRFSLAPILYYLCAKEREIMVVRLLAFGLKNKINGERLGVRVRLQYV